MSLSLNLGGQSPLRVFFSGKGEVALTQTDHLTTGGEGSCGTITVSICLRL